jgi:peptide/nickel transport system ATP-binding protein
VSATAPSPLLEVRGLTIAFHASSGARLEVVRDVSLDLDAGESLGIVGETGCGKSTLALALLGYLRPAGVLLAGTVRFAGIDLFRCSPRELERIRSQRVAYVPQDAGLSLTPTLRIGSILQEALRFQRGLTGADAQRRALELLREVRLPNPKAIARRYPHQLSGGQQQRVAIAIALGGEPDVIVFDEPTTGLDVVTQARILELLEEIRARTGAAMVYVSHNLGVIARVCDRLAVMYAGEVAELGLSKDVFATPLHPYTRALLGSVPRVSAAGLPETLAGQPPAPGALPAGCAFNPRCRFADELCRHTAPELRWIALDDQTRAVRCHHAERVADARAPTAAEQPVGAARAAGEVWLEVRELSTGYGGGGIGRALRARRGLPGPATALADISLELRRGETLALVGESGSGKSTLARVLAGLHPVWSGSSTFDGRSLTFPAPRRPIGIRRRIQLVFQNPDSSLNPRKTAGAIVERPLRLFFGHDRRTRTDRALALLEEMGLSATHLRRFPAQLSGGEKQRVAIARAFAAEPDLVLCDEIVSALDVSVQAAVLRLLDRLRSERDVAYLFISHDLAVVRAIADKVAVLYLGRLCEVGPVELVYRPPHHPYTEMLLAAVLEPVPGSRARLPAADDETEPEPPPTGCVFQRRCPRRVGAICDEVDPPWRLDSGGHAIRCHLELSELAEPDHPRPSKAGERIGAGRS